MIHLHEGLLFPTAILSSNWFQILTGFVAFNSIIYLGLTLARLIPLPPQKTPKILSFVAKKVLAEQEAIKLNQAPESLFVMDPYLAFRMRIMQETIPTALGLLASAVIAINLFSFLTLKYLGLLSYIVAFSISVLTLLFALYSAHNKRSPVLLAWVWMAVTTMAIAKVLVDSAGVNAEIDMALAGIFLALNPAMILIRLPTYVGVVLQGTIFLWTDLVVEGADASAWFLVGAAGLSIGLIIRTIRLESFEELAFERGREDALAATDLLTGVLTRVGIVSLEPSIFALALMTKSRIFLSICTLPNLATLLEDYGKEYCDILLHQVAIAVSKVSRPTGLVARWDASTFIVVTIGVAENAVNLKHRITAELKASSMELGKIGVEIDVGTASIAPEGDSFEALLENAIERLV
jgi:diguanylate cyclase (GGDEF)-like protein